jgi:CheY-like chemotaxis protein
VCQAIQHELGGEHDVVTSSSGAEALEIIGEDAHFDAILCDLHMPDVTGMDFFTQLRQSQPKLAGRVIFMTAGAFTDRARQFLAATGRPFVEKPLDLTRVRKLLEDQSQ